MLINLSIWLTFFQRVIFLAGVYIVASSPCAKTMAGPCAKTMAGRSTKYVKKWGRKSKEGGRKSKAMQLYTPLIFGD
jgi:hypothetical protein